MQHPPSSKRRIETGLCALLALALFGAAALAAEPALPEPVPDGEAGVSRPAGHSEEPAQSLEPRPRFGQGLSPRRTPLVLALERAKSAVVNIHSEKTAHEAETLFSTGKGRKVNGMGTGIVVDERGYVVTNYHVVNGVDSLRVTLVDGGTYMAQVVSVDQEHDLAIIRIRPSKPLSTMPLGTSSDLMLGETVVAVGNAFGYEHTVTAGIISYLSRDVEVNEKQSYKNLIQTDASINPGNSGGPLINMNGEVIGINVAIRAGAQRIGFAIPIDDARKAIARLMSVERLEQTWHGLATTDVKRGRERRLVVAAPEPGSPAARAGFQPGDVVVQAGEIQVVDAVDFERALLGHAPGEKIEIVVRRDQTTETLGLVLADKVVGQARAGNATDTVFRGNNGDHEMAPVGGAAREGDPAWRVLGVRLAKLERAERVLAGSRYRGGMRVLGVRAGSPAESNGIRAGDVLVGLHVWETISRDDISYVLNHLDFESFNPLKFYIVRGSETLFGHMRVVAGR